MTTVTSPHIHLVPPKFIKSTPGSGLGSVRVRMFVHKKEERVLIRQGKFEHSGCNTIFFPSIKLPEFITKLERVAVVGQEKSTISLQGKLYIMIKLLERGRSRLVTLTLQHTDYGMDALSEVVLDVPMGKQLFEGVKEIFLKSKQMKSGGEKTPEIPSNEGVTLSTPMSKESFSKGKKSKQVQDDKFYLPTLRSIQSYLNPFDEFLTSIPIEE